MNRHDKKHWDLTADRDGLSAYRGWPGRLAAVRNRRVMSDSSVYTLQGYKDWAEQIRKDWDDPSTDK